MPPSHAPTQATPTRDAAPQDAPHVAAGSVCLVGAGPGDPGLITTAGLERLRHAEVLIFDALANPVLLDEAPAGCEKIDAGRRAREHRLTQDQTNQVMADKALAGKRVVRLKGGDPYLFGRGAEEVAFLAERGVRCEVIPGITSGIAAPMMAGIPVTYRQVASTLTFVTGHEDPTKQQTAIDYAALARMVAAGGTACFYMGVGRLAAIVGKLTEAWLSPQTPAAVVQWGTLPKQRTVRSTLKQIEQTVEQAGITAPAIIVVGAVAAVDESGLDFFTSRPLFGKTVVVTRTRQQASSLRKRLEYHGARVLEAPTIELVPPADPAVVREAIENISRYDWLVLTSAAGVDALASQLASLSLDARHLASVKIAAVGEATSEALRQQLGLRADLLPARAVAESLAGEMVARQDLASKRVLLLRADIARPALPEALQQAGANVDDLEAYQTQRVAQLPDDTLQALREGSVDWVTFTSSSTAANTHALLGDQAGLLERVQIASIGPVTSATIRELGWSVHIQSPQADVASLADAMANDATA